MFTFVTKSTNRSALDQRDLQLRDQLAARTFGDRPLVPFMPMPSLPVNPSYDPSMRELRKAQFTFVAKPHAALPTAAGLARGEYHEFTRRMSFQPAPAPISVAHHLQAQDQRTVRPPLPRITPHSPIRLRLPRLERYQSQPRAPAT
jgi:hypothetical protein